MPRKYACVGHLQINKSWGKDKNKEQKNVITVGVCQRPLGQIKDMYVILSLLNKLAQTLPFIEPW